jgi:hypothetical protein
LLVVCVEFINSLGIVKADLCLGSEEFILIFSVFLLQAFDTHDAHEVISWVTQLWASIVLSGEIINSLAGFVVVNDFALCHKHENIKHIKDIRVWLMDGTNDSSATHCQLS